MKVKKVSNLNLFVVTKTGNEHKPSQTTSKRLQTTINYQQTTTDYKQITINDQIDPLQIPII